MYRSRLGSDLHGATLGYVSSVADDSEIMEYDIIGSQAHVLMLHRGGVIAKKDARRILRALENLKGTDPRQGDAGGGSEDIHELVESLVIRGAGMASGGRMHTARSRNDQVALDIRMKVRDDINAVCGCLLDAAEALVSVAKNHQRTVMPLYTHLQHAQAGLLSHYLLAHADALLRDYDRLYGTFARVNQSPLGAGPVGGTSIPIDRHYTAAVLGFDGLVENSMDATGTRDFLAEYVAMVSIMMTNLSRIAEDLVVWSSSEFGFIELADEFASPSSVMPQKKNPDILELTRGRAAETIGGLAAVLATVKGLASGYGRDLQQAKAPAWAASRAAVGALTALRSLVLTARVDKGRMKKVAESGNVVALDIAERLVMEGVPFRVTHRIAGALVRLADGAGKPISGLGAGQVRQAVSGTRVDQAKVSGAIASATVVSSLRERRSTGSSGYAEQKRMISDRARLIGGRREELAKRQNGIDAAMDDLAKQVGEMIGDGGAGGPKPAPSPGRAPPSR